MNKFEEFDRRIALRQSKMVGARILSPDGLAIGASCVCNLSSTGAMLRSLDCAGLERGFGLLIDGEDRARRCVIAWRAGNRIGIRFVHNDAVVAAAAVDLFGRGALRGGWLSLS